MNRRLQNGDRHHDVMVTADGSGYTARVDEDGFRVTLGAVRGGMRILFVDGRVVRVQLGEARQGTGDPPRIDGRTTALSFEQRDSTTGARGRRERVVDGVLKSPMPGRVLRVCVKEGDRVTATTEVVVVEAMKMENQLFAPCAGRVETVWVTPGQAVEAQADLLRVVPD